MSASLPKVVLSLIARNRDDLDDEDFATQLIATVRQWDRWEELERAREALARISEDRRLKQYRSAAAIRRARKREETAGREFLEN